MPAFTNPLVGVVLGVVVMFVRFVIKKKQSTFFIRGSEKTQETQHKPYTRVRNTTPPRTVSSHSSLMILNILQAYRRMAALESHNTKQGKKSK